MIQHRLIILCHVALLTLSACKSSPPIESNELPDTLNQQIIDRKFELALKTLESQTGDSGDAAHQHRLNQVRDMARRYDAQQAERALQFQVEGNWDKAFQVLDESRENLPSGEALQQVKELIEKEQKHQLQTLKNRQLLLRGEWLVRSTPIYEAIARTDPRNEKAVTKARELAIEIEQTASKLSEIGQQAFADHDLARAYLYLDLASRLSTNQEIETTLASIKTQSIKEQQKQQIKQERTRSQEEEERRHRINRQQRLKQRQVALLTTQVHQSLADGDLITARQNLSRLRNMTRNPVNLANLQQELDDAIAVRVNVLLERGRNLYTSGHIRQAKYVWEQALQYDPENQQVLSRIERATTVLDKVRQLQNKPIPNP